MELGIAVAFAQETAAVGTKMGTADVNRRVGGAKEEGNGGERGHYEVGQVGVGEEGGSGKE